MIDFKTTQKLDFQPNGRKVINDYMYVKVLEPILGRYFVRPKGYYYYVDEHGNEVKLQDFTGQISWQDIEIIEPTLTPIDGMTIKSAFNTRAEELSLIRIDKEYNEDNENNWGIHSQILQKL